MNKDRQSDTHCQKERSQFPLAVLHMHPTPHGTTPPFAPSHKINHNNSDKDHDATDKDQHDDQP